MTATCTCYRCNHHLTMNEALTNWCFTCREEPQLQPINRQQAIERLPRLTAPEMAVRR